MVITRARTQFESEVTTSVGAELAALQASGADLFTHVEGRARTIEEALRERPKATELLSEFTTLQTQVTRAHRSFDRAIRARDLASARSAALASSQLGPQFDDLATRLGIVKTLVLPDVLARAAQAFFDARYADVLATMTIETANAIEVPLRVHALVIRAAALFALYEYSGARDNALRTQARERFGLPADGPVLLVFGGSQGARTLNTALAAALPGLVDAGIAVLHAHGKAGAPAGPAAGYVGLPYIDAMDLAYAAADAVLGRCGAMTVAEVSAVGLPAVYVPLPHGNGEQALNAAPVVAAEGGVLVPDAELTGDRVLAELVPLLTDPARLAAMGAAARRSAHADAADRLARLVLDVGGKNTGGEAA